MYIKGRYRERWVDSFDHNGSSVFFSPPFFFFSFISFCSGKSEKRGGSLASLVPFRLSDVARRHGSLSAYPRGAIC